MDIQTEKEKTDRFEFFAAFLLGIAAIATALASLQSGLWDGKMVEAYGKSNKVATAAASENSRAMIEMSKDTQVDLQAYQQILEAKSNPATLAKTEELVTYLYTSQLSDTAYKAFGFPPKPSTFDDNDPATEDKVASFTDDVLTKAEEFDLVADENYRKEMLAKSTKLTEESEAAFKEGQEANGFGDGFEFANVIFAISLFFTGISLVLKSNIRWTVMIIGGILLIAGAVYIATLPWTFS